VGYPDNEREESEYETEDDEEEERPRSRMRGDDSEAEYVDEEEDEQIEQENDASDEDEDEVLIFFLKYLFSTMEFIELFLIISSLLSVSAPLPFIVVHNNQFYLCLIGYFLISGGETLVMIMSALVRAIFCIGLAVFLSVVKVEAKYFVHIFGSLCALIHVGNFGK